MNQSPAVQEAVKEFFRVLISGLVPMVIAVITMMVSGVNQETGEIKINWAIIGAVAFVQLLTTVSTALTRAWDKYTHESNKVEHPKDAQQGKSMGIIPF